MAYEFNGSNQYLEASDPIDAVPLTLALWFNCDTASNQNLIWISNTAATHAFGIYPSSASLIRGYVAGVGGTADFGTTTTYSTNTWHHACLSCASNNSRAIYLDGGGSTTNTATVTPTSANITNLRVSWPANALNGLAAEIGVWNTNLTATEIASLAAGFTCDKVRPQNLVFYAPIIRNLQDIKGGLTITNNNTATLATHPRVYA